jgi:hypothetical protein
MNVFRTIVTTNFLVYVKRGERREGKRRKKLLAKFIISFLIGEKEFGKKFWKKIILNFSFEKEDFVSPFNFLCSKFIVLLVGICNCVWVK